MGRSYKKAKKLNKQLTDMFFNEDNVFEETVFVNDELVELPLVSEENVEEVVMELFVFDENKEEEVLVANTIDISYETLRKKNQNTLKVQKDRAKLKNLKQLSVVVVEEEMELSVFEENKEEEVVVAKRKGSQ